MPTKPEVKASANRPRSTITKENSRDELLISPHAHSSQEITGLLKVDSAQGLSNQEAEIRLNRDGANSIEAAKSRSAWQILIGQFSSIIVWLLGFAAVVAWFTDSRVEALAILVVLVLNAVIGFAIEWQAGRALYALQKATHLNVRVRRGSSEQIIDAANIVLGDIVILTAGDRVPADARLIEAVNLRSDESTLTGESTSVEKSIATVKPDAPLAERISMLYLGTTIVSGRAAAVITATGKQTELGRIGQLIAETKSEQTPLERKLAQLGKRLVYIVLGVAALVMLAGLMRGDDLWLMLEVSVSLAVAAVPEGLPAVTTLILALGVLRMARRNALVRKLSAVETLGSATVICTDKTGTLTENRMSVQEYRLANEQIIKLLPDFTAGADGKTGINSLDENLSRLLRVSFLCNDASLDSTDADKSNAIGDPTETALLVAAGKFGCDVNREKSEYKKLLENPFDADTKRMITVLQSADGKAFAALKGAPAVVLDVCDTFVSKDGEIVKFDDTTRRSFLKINEEMADEALRVLAFADKNFADAEDLPIENGYTFLGFVGMSDPPREGVAEAVRRAQAAGIRVVMLTGDQINTARAIARRLNLSQGEEVFALHSNDLINAESEKLAEMGRTAHVFARVSPEDKLRIVEALQKAGEIVAVTGDGVNDAPALKRADIGVAMGMRGTEVAKEAADIVLTDDNFSTIVKAIEGGRAIYANIIKFVQMMFSHNLAEVIVIFVPIAAGLPLPLLPLQILWINLVTDVFPALALAVEPASADTMTRPPQSPKEELLSRGFLFLISWQGAMLAAIALVVYFWAWQTYGVGAHLHTVTLMTVVGVQLGHLYNCRSQTRSTFDGFFSNPYIFVATAIVIGLQLLAVYFAPLAKILGIVPPNNVDWLVIISSIILPIIIVEITKAYSRFRSAN